MPTGTLSVDLIRKHASWKLSQEELDKVAQGTKLESESFQLPGTDTEVVLSFFPHGQSEEKPSCRVFVEPQRVPFFARHKLKLGRKILHIGGSLWSDKRGLGWFQEGDSIHPTGAEITWEVYDVYEFSDVKADVKKDDQLKEKQVEEHKEELRAAQADMASVKRTLETKEKELAYLRGQLKAVKSEAETAAAKHVSEKTELSCQLRQAQIALELFKKEKEALSRHRRHTQSSSPTSAYDLVVMFQSLSEFSAKGSVEVRRALGSALNLALEGKYRIVAVVGLFDKGKTFLINKLFGINLPEGKLHTTKGLSFFVVKDKRMIILDTAGIQGPVSYKPTAKAESKDPADGGYQALPPESDAESRPSERHAVQPILDAQLTESFMLKMISRIAHHLIFVVNDITWFEQKHITTIHRKYLQASQAKEQPNAKELIIVHNLSRTGSVQEAEELFKKRITERYPGQQSHLTKLNFTADFEGEAGVPHMHHIALCEEGTEAGDMFNKPNCDRIMERLETINAVGSSVALPKSLEEPMAKLLPTFLTVEAAASAEPQKGASLSVQFAELDSPKQCPESEGPYEQLGDLVLSSEPTGAKVVMKTHGVISDLGEILTRDVTFNPTVNIYDKGSSVELRRVIEVECPGVEVVDCTERPNGVSIAIDKPKRIDVGSVTPFRPIDQCHGRWEEVFDFSTDDGKFVLCEDEITIASGVLMVPLRHCKQLPKVRVFSQPSSSCLQHYNIATPGGSPPSESVSSMSFDSGYVDAAAEMRNTQ